MTFNARDFGGSSVPFKTRLVDTDKHVSAHDILTLPGNVETDIAAIKAALSAQYVETAQAAQSGAASWSGPWFDARRWLEVWAALSWTAVGSTSGTIDLEGCVDPDQGSGNVVSLSAKIKIYYGTWPTVGTSAAQVSVPLLAVPPYLRWKYTRSAGGGSNQFTPRFFGRR
jgi:hypothetical protein